MQLRACATASCAVTVTCSAMTAVRLRADSGTEVICTVAARSSPACCWAKVKNTAWPKHAASRQAHPNTLPTPRTTIGISRISAGNSCALETSTMPMAIQMSRSGNVPPRCQRASTDRQSAVAVAPTARTHAKRRALMLPCRPTARPCVRVSGAAAQSRRRRYCLRIPIGRSCRDKTLPRQQPFHPGCPRTHRWRTLHAQRHRARPDRSRRHGDAYPVHSPR